MYDAPVREKLVGFGLVRTAFPPSSERVISEVSNIADPLGSVKASSSNSTISAVLSLLGVMDRMIGPVRSLSYRYLLFGWIGPHYQHCHR